MLGALAIAVCAAVLVFAVFITLIKDEVTGGRDAGDGGAAVATGPGTDDIGDLLGGDFVDLLAGEEAPPAGEDLDHARDVARQKIRERLKRNQEELQAGIENEADVDLGEGDASKKGSDSVSGVVSSQAGAGRSAVPLEMSASASDWNRGREKYAPRSVLDGDLSTAWCSRRGVGAWLSLSTHRPGRLTELVVRNGYQKLAADQYGDRYYTNSLPCNVLTLADHKQPQQISLIGCKQGSRLPAVRLTIESRYQGAQEPVCISEVVAYGNG